MKLLVILISATVALLAATAVIAIGIEVSPGALNPGNVYITPNAAPAAPGVGPAVGVPDSSVVPAPAPAPTATVPGQITPTPPTTPSGLSPGMIKPELTPNVAQPSTPIPGYNPPVTNPVVPSNVNPPVNRGQNMPIRIY